jgi:cytochrome c oxidase assembly protein subunit 15
MRRASNPERSIAVALWLFLIAALVLTMVVVGGATRLTGSGLSITEWRPVTGAVPPLSHQAWIAEFQRYQRIPQYRLLNRGMSLGEFQFIYWWEWTHRFLGRLIGVVFFVPFVGFLALRRMPGRLVWRCVLLLLLGGLQGAVGWWMVASGLSQRVSVAPERLATHLGLALIIYGFAVWTGLEAWFGRPRRAAAGDGRWRAWAAGLTSLVFLQILLGALVAGNQAGLVYSDWPLMNGRLFPAEYAGPGLWATLVHSQAAVQFNHRLMAYLIFILAIGFATVAMRSRSLPGAARGLALLLGVAVVVQVGLGIVTLISAVPLSLSITHQLWAVAVLTVALCLTWRVRRS